jgi:anthranilate phosphoribosyltransferase
VEIAAALDKITRRVDLTETEAHAVMNTVMNGDATAAQLGGLLVGLRMKGESVAEITGFARAMREHVVPVPHHRENVVDTCGTGGDKIKTFNLSTAAAILASAAGAPVAKHGNRAVTSKCGSADVLEALGVNLNLTPEQAGKQLDEIGITFLFAPNYHPAMKHAAAPRKEMKLRTVFNLLGPLTNPAGAKRQLLGVYSPDLVRLMAEVLLALGCERGVVAHGMIGLDEVSPIAGTKMAIIDDGRIEEKELQAEDFGITPPNLEEITCSSDDPLQSAVHSLQSAISDADSPECRAVLPSAGVALWVSGLASTIQDGVEMAHNSVADMSASGSLRRLR